MIDYTTLGLDSNLRPLNSPATNYGTGLINSMNYDSTLDRSAVTTTKIANLSVTNAKIADAAIDNAKIGTAAIGTANIGTLTFNEISGGTATLGGTANGNGVLSLKDSGGTQIVRLDNTGVLVNKGSITIQDVSGSSVIDSYGVNSVNVFDTASNAGTIGGGQDFTGTAIVPFTGGTLTFVTVRDTKAFIILTTQGYMSRNSGTDAYGAYFNGQILVDGDAHGIGSRYQGESDASNIPSGCIRMTTATNHSLNTYSAGTHTITVVGYLYSITGAPKFGLYYYQLSYFLLGK